MRQREIMFLHLWTNKKKPSLKPSKTFFSVFFFFHEWNQDRVCFSMCDTKNLFSAEKLIFRRETELKPLLQQWNKKKVCLSTCSTSSDSFFRFIFNFFYRKQFFSPFFPRFVCETELKLIFHVWHQEKLWFSMKNIFDFFFRWKGFVCETELKTCFLFRVWNRIETKWK